MSTLNCLNDSYISKSIYKSIINKLHFPSKINHNSALYVTVVNGPCNLTYKYKYVTWTKQKISNDIYQRICRKWANTWPCFYCFSKASEKFSFLVQYSQVLGLRMRRWMGPLLVDLMIFQASWCMSPSREHPLMDRTSSPTSISPDSSAAPPNGKEYRRSKSLFTLLLTTGKPHTALRVRVQA